MIHRVNIGRFELISIQTQPQELASVQDLFPDATPETLELARARQPEFFGEDATKAYFTQNICLVRSPEITVLVDTGLPLEGVTSPLLEGLASLGVQADHVDLVFFTHRDGDHVGGTVNADGQLVFNRARHLISRLEFDDYRVETARAEQFQKWIKPLQDRGLLEFFDGQAVIADGLTAIPTPGHRSGATSLLVEDGDQAAFLLADVLHLPVQVTHPNWSSIWDWDKALAAQTRQQVIERARREHLLLAVPHAPFPGLGYITRAEDGSNIWSTVH